MIAKISLTSLLILLFSCNQAKNNTEMPTLPLYKEGFIRTDRIKLHYLDWGDSGQILGEQTALIRSSQNLRM